MIHLTNYIQICEELEDNLFFKLDTWFGKDQVSKSNFINIINKYRELNFNKETLAYMLKDIGFDTEKFVDFITDNINKQNVIDDYLYVMQKTIESIIANKNNDYNIEDEKTI